MARISAERGITVGAIHGKYGPELRQYVKHRNGHYGLAVRHPVSRVNSCAAWAKAKVEAGQRLPLSNAADACQAIFKGDFSFSELLFAFAAIHIFSYDEITFSSVYSFDQIYRMEDYTANAGALEQLVSATAMGRSGTDVNFEMLVNTAPCNAHSSNGLGTEEYIFSGWPDKHRMLFAKLIVNFPIALDRHRSLGYDVRAFVA